MAPGRRPGDGATEHLPPVDEPEVQREPELLTHRDDDYLSEPVLAASRSEGGPADPREEPRMRSEEGPKRVKMWRWIRRSIYVLVALGIFAPIVAFFVMYQIVKVPVPSTVENGLNQPVTMYYNDGSVMYSLNKGTANHSVITYGQIPQVVQHAVFAAEDETFQTNPGFDLKAIFRTAYNKLSGAQGGASTISQEYIKQAFNKGAADQRTASNKIEEIVQAYKMTKTYGKEDILTGYLNIVYFGRGAYGIKAAAKEYFNIDDLNKLTPEQAALLAGMIQNPSRSESASYRQFRYSYVMGRMAANNWIPQSDVTANPSPPAMIPKGSVDSTNNLPWDRQLIVDEVETELSNEGWPMEKLEARGAKIYTTIDPNAQTDAENSVNQIMAKDTEFTTGQKMTVTQDGDPQNISATEATALVSVDQHTGDIVAWYGGNNPQAAQYDLAATPEDPGSSFKPYVFAAGLEKDPGQIGLQAVYNGSNNQVIGGVPVNNSEGEGDPQDTVYKAMTESINTVFYQMGFTTGTGNVAQAAYNAGIPTKIFNPATQKTADSLQNLKPDGETGTGVREAGISIGQYPVRPMDQAQGYQTIANDGMKIQIHFVSKVTDDTGSQLYQFNSPPTPWFDNDQGKSAQIADTVRDAMTGVAAYSNDALAKNRPSASKTGTAQYLKTAHNSEAWMVGFTPEVTTAVWFGHYDRPQPVYGNYHNGEGGASKAKNYDVYGREEPAYIWKAYMDSYLANKPVTQFNKVQDLGGHFNFVTNQDSGGSSGDNSGNGNNSGGSTDNTASSDPSSNQDPGGNPNGAPTGGGNNGGAGGDPGGNGNGNGNGQGIGQIGGTPPTSGRHKPCNPITGCTG